MPYLLNQNVQNLQFVNTLHHGSYDVRLCLRTGQGYLLVLLWFFGLQRPSSLYRSATAIPLGLGAPS